MDIPGSYTAWKSPLSLDSGPICLVVDILSLDLILGNKTLKRGGASDGR